MVRLVESHTYTKRLYPEKIESLDNIKVPLTKRQSEQLNQGKRLLRRPSNTRGKRNVTQRLCVRNTLTQECQKC